MRSLVVVSLLVAVAVPAGAQRTLYDVVVADSATEQLALGGCVRIHHVWKREVTSLHRTAGKNADARMTDFIDSVYRPDVDFWAGYVGDEAAMRRMGSDAERFDLETDPRGRVPTQMDIGGEIARTLERVASLTARRACGQWYLVYGPGFTNLGGLTGGAMLIDFFGIKRADGLNDIRMTLPHELNHIVFGDGHPGDPDRRTLLWRIIDEGFASYFAHVYWGDSLSKAASLGYTTAELDTAIAHEAELWARARPLLASVDRNEINRWAMASARLAPGLPGKIGYFLGYQVVEAYVRKHGAASWKDLYDLPVAEILRESGKDH